MLKKDGRVSACCLVALVLLVLLAGCGGEDSQTILDLVPLQVQLTSEYAGSNIVVEFQDGETIGITVAGDAAGSLARGQAAEQARRIAEFACEHYASMSRIEKVWVAFTMRQEGLLGDATASATFTFASSELECGGR